jgi:hypothetical protein
LERALNGTMSCQSSSRALLGLARVFSKLNTSDPLIVSLLPGQVPMVTNNKLAMPRSSIISIDGDGNFVTHCDTPRYCSRRERDPHEPIPTLLHTSDVESAPRRQHPRSADNHLLLAHIGTYSFRLVPPQTVVFANETGHTPSRCNLRRRCDSTRHSQYEVEERRSR